MTLIGPNAAQLKCIRDEIGEQNGTLEENLKVLKNWLPRQPHLPQSIEEQVLKVFIRGCKHNVERVKKKLDCYYTGRAAVPELFIMRDPEKVFQDIRHAIQAFPLPKLTPDGCRITIHRFRNFDPSELEVHQIFKFLFMIGDLRMMEESIIAGDIYLFDLQDVELAHCTKLTTPFLRKTLILAQEAYPQRLKQIHVFNAPPFADWILNIFKSFMKEKMKNRFFVHAGYRELHEHVPQNILPVDYGGEESSCETLEEEWHQKLISYREWFTKEEEKKANEKYRPNRKSHYTVTEELFGYDGAFKTLSID